MIETNTTTSRENLRAPLEFSTANIAVYTALRAIINRTENRYARIDDPPISTVDRLRKLGIRSLPLVIDEPTPSGPVRITVYISDDGSVTADTLSWAFPARMGHQRDVGESAIRMIVDACAGRFSVPSNKANR